MISNTMQCFLNSANLAFIQFCDIGVKFFLYLSHLMLSPILGLCMTECFTFIMEKVCEPESAVDVRSGEGFHVNSS